MQRRASESIDKTSSPWDWGCDSTYAPSSRLLSISSNYELSSNTSPLYSFPSRSTRPELIPSPPSFSSAMPPEQPYDWSQPTPDSSDWWDAVLASLDTPYSTYFDFQTSARTTTLPLRRPYSPSSESSRPGSPLAAFRDSSVSSRRSSLASTLSSSSSSPYPSPHALITPLPDPTPAATKSRRSRRHPPPADAAQGPKSCSHCGSTRTPLWRRHPDTRRPLCNACGLYLAQRGSLRPDVLIEADEEAAAASADGAHEKDEGERNGKGHECSTCGTQRTSVWRRAPGTGARVCNACGVYARLRGKERPERLRVRRGKVRPRCKHDKV